MHIITTEIPGVLIIEPQVFRDERGFFLESYNARKYRDAGILLDFVQDNHSSSQKNTLRGLHAQLSHPQAKLIRVIKGDIYDVAVDIRIGSPTFGSWVSVILSAENAKQAYIPPGFAHGFCVLSESADIEYKCTDFYDPSDEIRLLWNDPDLSIDWPVASPILSAKDRDGSPLRDLIPKLPAYEPVACSANP
jgi:dTDP-4-dehydrorhamnose 3,5-epimerase